MVGSLVTVSLDLKRGSALGIPVQVAVFFNGRDAGICSPSKNLRTTCHRIRVEITPGSSWKSAAWNAVAYQTYGATIPTLGLVAAAAKWPAPGAEANWPINAALR